MPGRSGSSWCADWPATCAFRTGARCTRCSTAMALGARRAEAPGPQGHGHAALAGGGAQRPVVRRLQGRARARQRPLLLPPTVTDQASRYLLVAEALETTKEAPVIEAFIPLLQGPRPAAGDPKQQWRPLRQPERPLQSLQAVGLVAEARHRNRAHQAGAARGERPARAHASNPEAETRPAAG